MYITKGTYTTTKSGNDFIVKVGNQKILMKDALADSYNKITIKNSKNKISVYNDWKIRYGSVESNYASNVTLAGSKNNDTIKNSGYNVTIEGNAGNDVISNEAWDVLITGGFGKESITSWNENVTISGGKGNDYIDFGGRNNVIQYASDDGNDTITGLDSDDILHITKGSYSTKGSVK